MFTNLFGKTTEEEQATATYGYKAPDIQPACPNWILNPLLLPTYADDVPLEGPKTKMAKKWSGNGFGPSQMTCPKKGQKVPKKWSKKGPRKIWDHKKTNFAWAFDK